MSSPTGLWYEPPPPPSRPPEAPADEPRASVAITIDGKPVETRSGTTILEACRASGIDVPTLCYLETLEPANACRLCVVELEGARTLVPSCSRKVEPGMKVGTDSARVQLSRRLVLELLGSSVDLSLAETLKPAIARYGAKPERFGVAPRETTVKVDNDLYVRDYSKCVLCYRCVQACGEDAQNTFAIGVAGRGHGATISTEHDVPLPESACVYCGNCIAVCPTGALMPRSEHELRKTGAWNESAQTTTKTVCPYCGVGCPLELHVQDERIVKVTSPLDSSITHGNLCIKGRFGFEFVQLTKKPAKDAPRA
ncbi:(2Fe-2S)-binding protein [bacterium]|nr:(2Fe-2S)-binding protein [bacterium]